MPGLVPGIHVLTGRKKEKNVDGRDKPGHDGETDCRYWVIESYRSFHSGFSARISRTFHLRDQCLMLCSR